MKVVIDTNVLFSMIFHPSRSLAKLMECLLVEHQPLIFDYVAAELLSVAIKKRPEAIDLVYSFLDTISIEPTGSPISKTEIKHRDSKDQPILDAAIYADVDIIITGDRGFHALDLHKPRVMTPAQFIAEFVGE